MHGNPMFRTVLVPVDGSEYSRMALEVAHRLVTPNQATIYILHVPEIPPARDALGMAAGATALTFSREQIEQAGRELIEKLEHAEESGHHLIDRLESAVGMTHVETKPVVSMGRPAEVILEEAKRQGVDAIVMGSRGMSDLKGLLIGSVSHKVMHTAPCRVILVH